MKQSGFQGSTVNREQVVVRTSLLGIGANLLLAGFKILVGLLSSSFAVLIDGINNFSDALSSVITIIGTKLAGRRADSQHPLGHGRIEYFTTLLVTVIILYAGVTALVESIKKIIHPEEMDFSPLSLIVLGVAVFVKVFLGLYTKKRGEQVDSEALKASGKDALFDAILSASVLASAIIFVLARLNLEAYVGLVISLFILKSAYEMLKDTIGELIGKRVPRETVNAVKASAMEDPDVGGVYDVILHSYGPNRYVGSIHVSVPDSMSAREIDVMERRVAEKVYRDLGILLTGVGIYVEVSGDQAEEIQRDVQRLISGFDGVLQIHGFHVDTEKKYMGFDVVLDFALEDRSGTFQAICDAVQAKYPEYEVRAVLDLDV